MAGALLLPGCAPAAQPSGGGQGGGDPGNRRLSQLAADPVFKSLPPGAVAVGRLVLTPARFTRPAFQPAGWNGPSAALSFTSAQPAGSVFGYFAVRAAAAGWQPGNRNALGYPQTWTKTYPDGVPGTLSLLRVGRSADGAPITYSLTASSPAAG